jgi:hypothetical protein
MTPPTFIPNRTDRTARLLAAVAISAAGGAATWWFLALRFSDFEYFHVAARLVLAGVSPYDPARWPLSNPYPYPLPAALVLVPLAPLSMRVAGGIFIAVSTLLLALGLTRDRREGLWPLLAFATPAYAMAVRLGQWTPLLVAATLWPLLAPVASLKPSLGVPVFVAAPSRAARWWAVAGGALLALVAMGVQPTWPREWLGVVTRDAHHVSPVGLPGGALLLTAALRWRRPEARLLLALACVPQIFMFADQLLLVRVPRTPRERIAQAALMWAGLALLVAALGPHERPLVTGRSYVLFFAYLPALVMVLRRPNEGPTPAWLERSLDNGRALLLRAGQSLRGRGSD